MLRKFFFLWHGESLNFKYLVWRYKQTLHLFLSCEVAFSVPLMGVTIFGMCFRHHLTFTQTFQKKTRTNYFYTIAWKSHKQSVSIALKWVALKDTLMRSVTAISFVQLYIIIVNIYIYNISSFSTWKILYVGVSLLKFPIKNNNWMIRWGKLCHAIIVIW